MTVLTVLPKRRYLNLSPTWSWRIHLVHRAAAYVGDNEVWSSFVHACSARCRCESWVVVVVAEVRKVPYLGCVVDYAGKRQRPSSPQASRFHPHTLYRQAKLATGQARVKERMAEEICRGWKATSISLQGVQVVLPQTSRREGQSGEFDGLHVCVSFHFLLPREDLGETESGRSAGK